MSKVLNFTIYFSPCRPKKLPQFQITHYICYFYFHRLESATRALEIKAPERVVIESRAGGISATSLSHLTLQSIEGSIKFDANSVFLKGLKVGSTIQRHTLKDQQRPRNSRSSSDDKDTGVYQLCTCANGKLFLARADGICQADKTIC